MNAIRTSPWMRFWCTFGGAVAIVLAAGLQPAEAAPEVRQLALGDSHSCALSALGGVKCWGDNSLGQVGNGGSSRVPTPVDVVGLTSGVVEIAAGSHHTCALTSRGEIRCWGSGNRGQLGTGFNDQRLPVRVNASVAFRKISADEETTCAVSVNGTVHCWGSNYYGEVDPNDAAGEIGYPRSIRDLPSSAGIARAEVGANHVCALTSGGALYCWGAPAMAGRPGAATTPGLRGTRPAVVPNLAANVVAVSARVNRTCAIKSGGSVWCWGHGAPWMENYYAVSGLVTGTPIPLNFAAFSPGSGIASISVGADQDCAVTVAGKALCWNYTFPYGVVSYGPASVVGLERDVVAVESGSHWHSCAIVSTFQIRGAVLCWGNNDYGQLGSGSFLEQAGVVPALGFGAQLRCRMNYLTKRTECVYQ